MAKGFCAKQTRTLQLGEDTAEKADERAPQNHEKCGDFKKKLFSLPHWYRNYQTPLSLPGERLKTMGRGSFMQFMISCGATCCKTLQAVRFFIAPRKIKGKEIFFEGLVNTKASLLPQGRSVLLLSMPPYLWFGLWMLQLHSHGSDL